MRWETWEGQGWTWLSGKIITQVTSETMRERKTNLGSEWEHQDPLPPAHQMCEDRKARRLGQEGASDLAYLRVTCLCVFSSLLRP